MHVMYSRSMHGQFIRIVTTRTFHAVLFGGVKLRINKHDKLCYKQGWQEWLWQIVIVQWNQPQAF